MGVPGTNNAVIGAVQKCPLRVGGSQSQKTPPPHLLNKAWPTSCVACVQGWRMSCPPAAYATISLEVKMPGPSTVLMGPSTVMAIAMPLTENACLTRNSCQI